ncbi:MAG: hypothetical protein JXB04_00520 [Kiritimatiellae bacterium]|nr:hypothetical protein [Kiritimatiellia bacterium]
MREFLSESNLKRAVMLSLPCTLASVPRVMYGQLNPWFFVPAAFLSLTFAAGMATAWGHRAGLTGLWPERQRLVRGLVIATLAALVLTPAALAVDPILESAFAHARDPGMVGLQYPDTAGGVTALLLWAAAFETVFFVAAAAAFFARISGRTWMVIVGPVILRAAVACIQLSGGHVTEAVPLLLAGVAATTALTCVLFARYGLPAASIFIAILSARLFLRL